MRIPLGVCCSVHGGFDTKTAHVNESGSVHTGMAVAPGSPQEAKHNRLNLKTKKSTVAASGDSDQG